MNGLVLVDTSAWTQALRRDGDPAVRARVEALLDQESVAWCDMVRLELWNRVRGEPERRRLTEMDRVLPRLPITEEVWEAACRCATHAGGAGLTVPATDLVIFACAKVNGTRIEQADRHFELLEALGAI